MVEKYQIYKIIIDIDNYHNKINSFSDFYKFHRFFQLHCFISLSMLQVLIISYENMITIIFTNKFDKPKQNYAIFVQNLLFFYSSQPTNELPERPNY